MARSFCIALICLLIGISAPVNGATHVRGYVRRSTGHYVAPHYKSRPDHSRLNNYSTRGNINPYTGKKGTLSPLRRR